MNIPKTVKIGGIEYKVIYEEMPCRGDANIDGQIRYSTAEISLRSTDAYSKDYTDYAFIHECVHGIIAFMEIENSEELVCKLSKGLHMFIKDNPNIFKE